jgi:hypothetical protein
VGSGRQLDGTNDYINLGTNLPLLMNVGACTLSAWVNVAMNFYTQDVVSVSLHGSEPPTFRVRAYLSLDDYFRIWAGGRASDLEELQNAYSASWLLDEYNWHYLVAVIDYANDGVTMFLDGQRLGAAVMEFTSSATSDTTVDNAALGSAADGSYNFLDGLLDEVRIAAATRPESWVLAEFLNMTDQFMFYEPEESKP